MAKFDTPNVEVGREPGLNRKKPMGARKFVNKRGEQDLSLATGPEALKAFASIGLKFPPVGITRK